MQSRRREGEGEHGAFFHPFAGRGQAGAPFLAHAILLRPDTPRRGLARLAHEVEEQLGLVGRLAIALSTRLTPGLALAHLDGHDAEAPLGSLRRLAESPIWDEVDESIRGLAGASGRLDVGRQAPRLYSLHREYGLSPDAIPAPPKGDNYVLIGPADEPKPDKDESDKDDATP